MENTKQLQNEQNKSDGGQADILYAKLDSYITYMDRRYNDMKDYISIDALSDIDTQYDALKKQAYNASWKAYIPVTRLHSKIKALKAKYALFKAGVEGHNAAALQNLSSGAKTLIDPVEGRHLDQQQLCCLVKSVHNHLVIAGAGTGKTTTIVGKIKYLLNSGKTNPEDILVLSFTNASAAEMRERIAKETGHNIEASTFHKLGLNILREVTGITPKITRINLSSFVKDQMTQKMKDPKYLTILCNYLMANHKTEKSEFDFQTREEYDEYLKMNPPITCKGDAVKSYGEMDIANFLYQNGIAYEYEKEYEIDTRTQDKAQYYPDFYLSDYGIYMEYFGIDEKGEVPAYFSSENGKSPSEEYRESMEWKRNLHKENNTTLIECYAYERFQGQLLSLLESKLKEHEVKFEPISPQAMWEDISRNNAKNLISSIGELISTIITLLKSNNYPVEYLRKLSTGPIVDLVIPIYEAYQAELKKNDEIDFNDMINDAARLIREGKYTNPYKFVIVDEYQDISKARFNLLKALRESNNYDLFCVGDDWQSIYRFAGSDMDYILNFSKYWGNTEYSKIETTYRFTDSLIDISGSFVMSNPAQIRKNIHGTPSKLGFALGEVKGYTDELAIRFMIKRLKELPQNSTVFFIGRYTFDSKLLSDCEELECRYDAGEQKAIVVYPPRKDLKMEFVTAHKSKGLQADYVFIINNKNKGMGFPSKIQNDPLVESLLEGKESFPFAEERRLFYVALTRAKAKAFLVVVQGNESEFVIELEKMYQAQLKQEFFTCPWCGGTLEKRMDSEWNYFGCRNSACGFKRYTGRKYDNWKSGAHTV